MKDGRFPSSFSFVSVVDAMISLRCSSKAFWKSIATGTCEIILEFLMVAVCYLVSRLGSRIGAESLVP